MDTVQYKATPEEAFFITKSKSANIIERDWEVMERNVDLMEGGGIEEGLKNSQISHLKLVSAPKIDVIKEENTDIQRIPSLSRPSEAKQKPFIEANTTEVTLQHLSNDCIIPVFSKDNELTIAHQQFISSVMECVQKVFPAEAVTQPEIRVSHQIKGRTPDAIHLNVQELQEHQKTIYYERIMFIARMPAIKDLIDGNELSLTFGGVRSYNLENLYNKKSMERFKFFIGFQNKVCSNMCVWSDGFISDLRVSSASELERRIVKTVSEYDAELHLSEMKKLAQDNLSESQFAQLIGKSRLYQHLPKPERMKIPEFSFNDSHINLMAKGYYEDENFSRDEDGRINLWDVYNLFTQANKSSYIDSFLDRGMNAFSFSQGLQKALNGNSGYHWFLS